MANKQQGVQWDLTSYFPAFNGPEMIKFKKKLAADIAACGLKVLGQTRSPVTGEKGGNVEFLVWMRRSPA